MSTYTVIIVNYRTEDYTLRALQSVIASATCSDFSVVVVDNGSSVSSSEVSPLARINDDRVTLLQPEENLGYARGNNLGIRRAVQNFQPDFLVVMNPDVEITDAGTIERLIGRVENGDEDVVGVQPLVHDCNSAKDPARAPQIRRVPTFLDLIISESLVLRLVFARRFRRFLMMDLAPYQALTSFLVPSGAFFIMRAQTFADVGYFDEGTFLFGEEYILGEKLRRLGKALILDPQECVRHFQGASTGFGRRRRPDRRMHRFRAQSTIYFAENYLHVGPAQRMALKVALTIGFAVRVAAWLPTRFAEGTRSLINLFRKHAA